MPLPSSRISTIAASARLNGSLTAGSDVQRRCVIAIGTPASSLKSRCIAARSCSRVCAEATPREPKFQPSLVATTTSLVRLPHSLGQQLVGNIRTVVPGGVEHPHAELDRPPQDAPRLGQIRRRPGHARSREPHRAEAHTWHQTPVELDGGDHSCSSLSVSTISTICGTVSRRFQSRWSSQASDTHRSARRRPGPPARCPAR